MIAAYYGEFLKQRGVAELSNHLAVNGIRSVLAEFETWLLQKEIIPSTAKTRARDALQSGMFGCPLTVRASNYLGNRFGWPERMTTIRELIVKVLEEDMERNKKVNAGKVTRNEVLNMYKRALGVCDG